MGVNDVPGGSSLPLTDMQTPMLGRDQDVAGLESFLADGAIRLLTITGPGGVGKTRLAMHVAGRCYDQAQRRVVFVPLAAIRDPSLVLLALGQAFGLIMDAPETYEQRLVDYLQSVETLLVLDNLEQVLDVAPAVARLLRSCPGVTILATSQAPLSIRGEQLFPLLPLTTHDTEDTSIDDLMRSDAVTLFVHRASAINPRLSLDAETTIVIARICRRLDGLPLAIELAAARTNLLTPANLLARLDDQLRLLGQQRVDIPDRFRTMRAAVAWSYDLLDPAEQALFRQLSVFLGGFSPDVAGASPAHMHDRSGLDVLGALVDRSLVQRVTMVSGDARFLMLEPIRDYGIDRLHHHDEDDSARNAHADFMVRLVEEAETHLVGARQMEWSSRIDAEIENIRTAVDWSLAHGQGEMVLRVCGALSVYLRSHGLANDGMSWLTGALKMSDSRSSTYRAKALVAAGVFAETQKDLPMANVFFSQARHLAEATGETRQEIRAVYGLGSVAREQADMARALALFEDGVRLSTEIDDRRGLLQGQDHLAIVAYLQGRMDDAAVYYEKSIPLLIELDDIAAQALVFGNLGTIYFLLDRVEAAISNIRQAIASQRQLGSQRDLPMTLNNLGMILLDQGDFIHAREAIVEAIAIHKRVDDVVNQAVATHSLATLALAEGHPEESAELLLACMEMLATQEMPYRLLEIADLLAEICVSRNDTATAAELLGAGDRLHHDYGIDRAMAGKSAREDIVTTARKALGEDAFATHWALGEAMDMARLKMRMPIVARAIVGKRFTSPVIADTGIDDLTGGLTNSSTLYGLTERERQVLLMLVAGKSTVELSAALAIKPRTVESHISNIMAKMGVRSRTAAVALAMRDGLE